jgi:hypothetical protein
VAVLGWVALLLAVAVLISAATGSWLTFARKLGWFPAASTTAAPDSGASSS